MQIKVYNEYNGFSKFFRKKFVRKNKKLQYKSYSFFLYKEDSIHLFRNIIKYISYNRISIVSTSFNRTVSDSRATSFEYFSFCVTVTTAVKEVQ